VILEGTYKHTYYRNRLLIDRAINIQNILKKHLSGKFLLLKGMALILNVYDDIGGDCFGAKTLVDSQKFQYDIHRYINRHAISDRINDLICSRSVVVDAYGATFNNLCIEHQFVYIIYHAMLSPGVAYSSRWVFDIFEIIKNHELDIEVISELVEHLDLKVAIKIGLEKLLNFADVASVGSDTISKIHCKISRKCSGYTKFLIPIPQADIPSVAISRYNYLISVPFKARKKINLQDYYRLILVGGDPRKSIIKAFFDRVSCRIVYIFGGKWKVRD
jgi:hypothetical protein